MELARGAAEGRPRWPLVATAGATSQEDLITKLGNEADAMWDTVEQTDFGVRSKLLADEIAAARPDLVGLQEVALWRSGPVGMGGVIVPSASTVEYDFLAMLRQELEAAGVTFARSLLERVIEERTGGDTGTPLLPVAIHTDLRRPFRRGGFASGHVRRALGRQRRGTA